MIPVAEPSIGQQELRNITEAVESGWISSIGKFIPEFEEKFAAYCETKYGIATSSGTTALHLALIALGIEPGDEIIIPTLTFVATANAVIYTGARPVFVDSHPDYWCINPENIEEAITPRTKAIIPVHLYGHPCDMDAILDIARRHNIYVIEDAAEAHGAEYKGKRAGSFGDISCFSFYGNKIITTGEGGMCVTSNKQLADKMKTLRDHGMNPDKRYWHDIIGFNYRMTNMQAAIGVAQLERIDEFVEKKRELAGWYSEGLKDLAENKLVTLHPEMPWAKCVYWMYCILLEDKSSVSRDELMKRLKNEGIDTRTLFYPMHVLPPYRYGGKFPIAEELSQKGVNLPSGVTLTGKDTTSVITAVKMLLQQKGGKDKEVNQGT